MSPNPPFLQWPFTVQKKGMIALQGLKCYSYWVKISQKFHWLISRISWLQFSDLCAYIRWGWAIWFKNWHTLALAWLSISSTVDECWLQTLMLVFSCIFFSYSRTSSIVISVKSSKLLAFSTDSKANLNLLRRRCYEYSLSAETKKDLKNKSMEQLALWNWTHKGS